MLGRGRNLSTERSVVRLEVQRTDGLRLDHFILQSLAWRSRSRIQRLIREGVVTVNGEASKPSRRVHPGDVVILALSPGTGVPADYEDREIEVIYEDPWLLAVNKPPDMLVHPVGRHVYDTLINYLHYRYDVPGRDGGEVLPRLCHRIDRDTTGLVVIAKDAWVHREVSYQFEHRLVSKEYLTLVAGAYPDERERIDIPIGGGRCLESSLRHAVLKRSSTEAMVEARFRDHTLLRCVPHTGRQNQIRIHLAAVGHPVAGDRRFGDCPPREGHPQRHLLHAAGLVLHHPRLKTRMELRAPLPEDFRQVIERLAAAPSASPQDSGTRTSAR